MTHLGGAPDVLTGSERLRELEARVARLSTDVADLAAVVTMRGDAQQPVAEERAGPAYPTVIDWVEEYFCVVFARCLGGETRWCPRWVEHPEAVVRLEALWRSWEVLRLDPNLGAASWITSYLDPQLSVILGQRGPFAQCSDTRHSPPKPMASTAHFNDQRS